MGDTHATTKVRPGPAGISALVLDGKNCGLLRRVEGGAISADVLTEHTGPGTLAKKHISAVRYEEFALEIGFAMEAPVFDWIAAAWKMDHRRHDGSVLDCNEKLEVQAERRFTNALLTETTIPALDAAKKDPAWLRLKFAPERLRTAKGSGKASGSDPKHPEKIFLPSNFKLEIDGLDCEKVSAIESFTVKQALAADEAGEGLEITREPGPLSFPNLKITFAEVAVESWMHWFDDFVIKGNSGPAGEKSGKLTLLSPNQQPLASIALSNLGIFQMTIDTGNDQERHRLATAGLYCEAMDFRLGA